LSSGIVLAFITFLGYSVSDSIIKGLGQALGIFEISFFVSLFGLIPIILTRPRDEAWRDTFRLRHPALLNLRCLSGYVSGLCGTYAFLHIPLAEAYSLIFLTPVFVVLFSMPLFKERVGISRWLLLGASFLGVLLVVRPGFRDFQLGHLSAVSCAFFGAITTLLLKQISVSERRISMVVVPTLYALAVNGGLMLQSYTAPSAMQFVLLAMVGTISGTATLLFIIATRLAPIGRISMAHYSQIVWGGLLGAAFYNEIPDSLAIAGMLVVIVAGLCNALGRKDAATPLPTRARTRLPQVEAGGARRDLPGHAEVAALRATTRSRRFASMRRSLTARRQRRPLTIRD
jgi:drug/metabolite transporter (DMT)-like permease